MNIIRFVVEKGVEGGLISRAIGATIFTDTNDMNNLLPKIADPVRCHFDAGIALQRIILC